MVSKTRARWHKRRQILLRTTWQEVVERHVNLFRCFLSIEQEYDYTDCRMVMVVRKIWLNILVLCHRVNMWLGFGLPRSPFNRRNAYYFPASSRRESLSQLYNCYLAILWVFPVFESEPSPSKISGIFHSISWEYSSILKNFFLFSWQVINQKFKFFSRNLLVEPSWTNVLSWLETERLCWIRC